MTLVNISRGICIWGNFAVRILQQITCVCFGFIYVCLCLFIYLFVYNTAFLGIIHWTDLNLDRDADTDMRHLWRGDCDKWWHVCTSRIHGADPTVKQITPKFKAKVKFKCFCLQNSATIEAIISISLETESLQMRRKAIKQTKTCALASLGRKLRLISKKLTSNLLTFSHTCVHTHQSHSLFYHSQKNNVLLPATSYRLC